MHPIRRHQFCSPTFCPSSFCQIPLSSGFGVSFFEVSPCALPVPRVRLRRPFPHLRSDQTLPGKVFVALTLEKVASQLAIAAQLPETTSENFTRNMPQNGKVLVNFSLVGDGVSPPATGRRLQPSTSAPQRFGFSPVGFRAANRVGPLFAKNKNQVPLSVFKCPLVPCETSLAHLARSEKLNRFTAPGAVFGSLTFRKNSAQTAAARNVPSLLQKTSPQIFRRTGPVCVSFSDTPFDGFPQGRPHSRTRACMRPLFEKIKIRCPLVPLGAFKCPLVPCVGSLTFQFSSRPPSIGLNRTKPNQFPTHREFHALVWRRRGAGKMPLTASPNLPQRFRA